jgi:hypothetical protein
MNPRWLDFPTRTDPRGELMFAEGERHVPFPIRRVFSLYGVTAGARRGAHAHRQLEQCFIALHGSIDVDLDDGSGRSSARLERPARGLYVGPLVWSELRDFTPGAICLVLASDYYDEGDYIRDYREFLAAVSL